MIIAGGEWRFNAHPLVICHSLAGQQADQGQMKKGLKGFALLFGLLILGLSWPAWQVCEQIQNARSEDPLVWEGDILADDMAPIGVIQHGEIDAPAPPS